MYVCESIRLSIIIHSSILITERSIRASHNISDEKVRLKKNRSVKIFILTSIQSRSACIHDKSAWLNQQQTSDSAICMEYIFMVLGAFCVPKDLFYNAYKG